MPTDPVYLLNPDLVYLSRFGFVKPQTRKHSRKVSQPTQVGDTAGRLSSLKQNENYTLLQKLSFCHAVYAGRKMYFSILCMLVEKCIFPCCEDWKSVFSMVCNHGCVGAASNYDTCS